MKKKTKQLIVKIIALSAIAALLFSSFSFFLI
jgi:hypothetical protein